MYKFAALLAVATIVAAIASAATNAERTTSADRPKISMPCIQQMMSEANDLPAQSFDAF
jgi:hypothetical protein